MGGQVAAGESVDDALARETVEEAGLALAELRELGQRPPLIRRPVTEGYMVERIEVFRAMFPAASCRSIGMARSSASSGSTPARSAAVSPPASSRSRPP